MIRRKYDSIESLATHMFGDRKTVRSAALASVLRLARLRRFGAISSKAVQVDRGVRMNVWSLSLERPYSNARSLSPLRPEHSWSAKIRERRSGKQHQE